MMTRKLTNLSAMASLMLTGAIFGFFYAYACSVMWGLDSVAPSTAITAMQGINANVRNIAFAPAFFMPTALLGLAAVFAAMSKQGRAASAFALAAIVYLIEGQLLTVQMNVPLNEALAAISAPTSDSDARTIWLEYTGAWQFWNWVRTAASGMSLVLCGYGLLSSVVAGDAAEGTRESHFKADGVA